MTSSDDGTTTASIVIPAHNEERVIGRSIRALTENVRTGHFDIVVVCNGCHDATATAARAASDAIRVIELTEPGKHQALREGDAAAGTFPRVFVDADVEITASGIDRLVEALKVPGLLAAGPRRVIPRAGVHWVVRSYYDVWEALPSVRTGLFGRGVIALSAAGHDRLDALPEVMGDDLVISERFRQHERCVVSDAEVIIHPPKTVRDLHQRRVRASTGNAQADAAGLRHAGARTTMRDVVAVALGNPRLALRVPIFLVVVAAGRLGARRAVRKRDFATWRRDETSRQ